MERRRLAQRVNGRRGMKTFLVALDASLRAMMVLDTAIHLAQPLGAKLVLYRGVGLPPEVPIGLYMGATGDLEGVLVEAAKKDLETFSRKVPSELLGGMVVDVASPWDGICRAATDHAADVIFIGSHGYSGLDRILGTTAAKVVNHATCSVFVVRASL